MIDADRALDTLSADHRAMAGALLRRLLTAATRRIRWRSLGSLAVRGHDRVDVESIATQLADLGLVHIHGQRNRQGDFTPTRIELGDLDQTELEPLAERLLPQYRPPPEQPLLEALQRLIANGTPLPVPARLLVLHAFGHTKAARARDYAPAVQAHFGRPFTELVREHTDAVLTAGPFRYRFAGHRIDAAAFVPWISIPSPVVAALTDLEVDCGRVLTIENLTPFEAGCYADRDTLRIFTSGFPRQVEERWLRHVVAHPKVREVHHWGDLDPGGLYIYRTIHNAVRSAAPEVLVQPHRMDPSLLDHPATRPLTGRDQLRLDQYLADPTNPLRALALAMKASGRKLEQEALLGPL
ncbi:MAG: hypothetical protein ACI9WU_000384 [Myxococcota bacterium]|jgi:hypothetical protein